MNPQATKHEETIFRTMLIVAMILFAAIIRIVPHPWNLAPVGAMALFSGAVVRNRVMAFVFPLLAMLAGDCVCWLSYFDASGLRQFSDQHGYRFLAARAA